MTELWQAEDFEPHVGKIFRFAGTRHAFPLDRVEKDERTLAMGQPRRPFLLIFRGPRETVLLPAGLYRAEIEGGPAFELHVMPIHTPARDRQDYQAAFN